MQQEQHSEKETNKEQQRADAFFQGTEDGDAELAKQLERTDETKRQSRQREPIRIGRALVFRETGNHFVAMGVKDRDPRHEAGDIREEPKLQIYQTRAKETTSA